MMIKDFINDKLEKKGKSTNTEDYMGDLKNIDLVKDNISNEDTEV